MNDRLVKTINKILCLLLGNNSSVNSIIKQTGISDRTHVFEAIKTLHKGGLITEIKSIEHKQKKIKKLTPLGEEFAQLINSLIRFRDSYSKLPKFYKRKFRSLNHERKGRFIREFATEDYLIAYNSQIKINEVLLFRYVSISSLYHPNRVAMEILNQIIIDSITQQLSHMLNDILNVNKDVFTPISDLIASLESILNFTVNRINFNQAKNVVASILSVLNPPKEEMATRQIELKCDEQLLKQNYPGEYWRIQDITKALALYEELLSKST